MIYLIVAFVLVYIIGGLAAIFLFTCVVSGMDRVDRLNNIHPAIFILWPAILPAILYALVKLLAQIKVVKHIKEAWKILVN